MIRPRGYLPILIFALLPHGLEIPLKYFLLSLGFLTWALVADLHPRFAPPRWVLGLITLCAPALVYWDFRTLLGPDAATPLLMLLVSLKLFEVYTYRDSIVVLALVYLIGMYHLVFRQDLFATLYILVLLIWIFVFLFRSHQPPAAKNKGALQFKSLFGPETLVSIPVALLMFFFFPRFTSPFGRFIDTGDSKTGFSEELRPGDMANLAKSDEVAFRVEFKSANQPPTSELYFFGQSLSETDGLAWSKPKRLLPKNGNMQLTGPAAYEYRLTVEPRFGRQIFYLKNTAEISIKGSNSPFSYLGNDSVVFRDDVQKTFQVTGKTASTPIISDAVAADHLALPPNFLRNQPRVTNAIEILRKTPGDRKKISNRLLAFFAQQKMSYSLSTPTYRNIEELLFDKKIGFCEHFASAYALMARALGIPSRVIVGFQGGEVNQYGNYLVVRDRQAHAWVEILLEDNTWHLADPTSAVNVSRITLGDTADGISAAGSNSNLLSAAMASSLMYFDSLNSRLVLFYLNFDGASQIEFLQGVGLGILNKKTLWMVLGSIILAISLLMFILLRMNRRDVSLQQSIRNKLNEKLKNAAVAGYEQLGPLEILDYLKKSQDPKAQQLSNSVEEYAEIYYSNTQGSLDRARSLLHKLDKI